MTDERHPLRPSLFPNGAPYLRVLEAGLSHHPPLPSELSLVSVAAPSGISPIVEESVREAGLSLLTARDKTDPSTVTCRWETLPVTEKGKDEINFSSLRADQKINQFPGLFVIGRKDFLWTSYHHMLQRHGEEHFHFLARCYVLPDEKEECVRAMKHSNRVMIIKPPNYYCGIGIKLINNTADLPHKKNKMVVQEYLERPFLINNLKFDLRLYVLLTSIRPLRLYLYDEGLVRFATKEYSNDPADIADRFIHITNFSVNKANTEFVYNEQPGEYKGHKWNLKTLWRYMEEELRLDWRPVWEGIKDVCVKTVLCGRDKIAADTARSLPTSNNCFKLFGFDIFLDSDLKPWLLEVNNIPSLHINTIDAFVNRPMVAEMFNIVGLRIPRSVASKHEKAIRSKLDVRTGRLWEEQGELEREEREEGKETDLNSLTDGEVSALMTAEDELSQTRHWERIFPTSSTGLYSQFWSSESHYDGLLQAWETKYGGCEAAREQGRQVLADIGANRGK